MIEVDLTDILIQCPKVGFGLRKSTSCFTCEFYNGIIRATERGKTIPGTQAEFYQVSCKRPISRKLIKVISE